MQTAQGVTDATFMGSPLDNAGLREKYDEMHAKGEKAWFDDGRLERELILEMGKPWGGPVIEIGCGEGDLCAMMKLAGANPLGIDYSQEAVNKAIAKHKDLTFLCADYKNVDGEADVLVLQGVLEHLDDPFGDLMQMIEAFGPKTIITTSPGFINPRGIVWMTLHMLGAVMSKTDLHFIHPKQVEAFCRARGYRLLTASCDFDWAYDEKMVRDLAERIPLALNDGGIDFDQDRLERFLIYLLSAGRMIPPGTLSGAVVGYRIDL